MFCDKVYNVFNRKGRFLVQNLNLTRPIFCTQGVIENVKRNYETFTLKDNAQHFQFSNFLRKYCTKSEIRQPSYYVSELKYISQLLRNSEKHSTNVIAPYALKQDLLIEDVRTVLQKPWDRMSTIEMVENFEILAHYMKQHSEFISDPIYKSVAEVVAKRCSELNDEQLRHVLRCLELCLAYKDIEEETTKTLWTALDEECFKRKNNWSADYVLQMNFIFQNLKLSRASKFTWRSLKKLGSKLKHMSAVQLLQFCYCIKVNRKIPISYYEVEHHFNKYFDEYNIEDFAVLASTLKDESVSIANEEFILKIVDMLGRNIDSVSDFALSSILTICRFSHKKELLKEFEVLLNKLEGQLSKRSIQIVLQIANYQRKLIFERETMKDKIMDRCEKELTNMSLRDINNLVLYLHIFDNETKNAALYSAVVKELEEDKRIEEWQKTPKVAVEIVENLIKSNVCAEKILKEIMKPEFVKKCAKNTYYLLKPSYLTVDYCLELEHPQYDGPRLEAEPLKVLLKNHGSTSAMQLKNHERLGLHTKIAKVVMERLQEILGTDTLFHYHALLPHFPKRDIILSYDQQNQQLVEVKEKLSQTEPDKLKYAPQDGNKWFAIIIAGSNMITRNTFNPTGQLRFTLRQIERLGYTPIIIPFNKWMDFTTEIEQSNYIIDKLNDYGLLHQNSNSNEKSVFQQEIDVDASPNANAKASSLQ